MKTIAHQPEWKATTREISPFHVLALVAALSATVLVNVAYFDNSDIVVTVVCLVGLPLSALTWIVSGGVEATAQGVLALATGLFAYFPGLYYVETSVYHDFLPEALSLVMAVQVVTTLLMLPRAESSTRTPTPRSQYLWFTLAIGACLLGFGALLVEMYNLSSLSLPANAAFVGAIFIMYSSIFAGKHMRIRSGVISGIAIGVYMLLLFNTGGRLVIAALVFGAVFMVSMRVRSRWIKIGVIGGLAPALFLAARQRSEIIQESRGVNETGLESVVWPIDRFAELLSLVSNDLLSPTGGDTLFATAVFWVPRELWAGKPLGFGADLVAVVRPDLLGIGHSEAATVLGEWVWDFGVIGLIALPVVGTIVLRSLHKARGLVANRRSFGSQVLAPIALVIVGPGMLDLFWIGTFGFASRAGQRLIILTAILVIYLLLSSGQRSANGGRHLRSRHSKRLSADPYYE